MHAPRRQQQSVRRYTVLVEQVAKDAWHLTVSELPATWTVAFSREEIERKARDRIALDVGIHPDAMEIRLIDVTPPSSRRGLLLAGLVGPGVLLAQALDVSARALP